MLWEFVLDAVLGLMQANLIVLIAVMITVNGFDYDKRDVEDALDELGYDFDDLESGFVDEDELEEILEDM